MSYILFDNLLVLRLLPMRRNERITCLIQIFNAGYEKIMPLLHRRVLCSDAWELLERQVRRFRNPSGD